MIGFTGPFSDVNFGDYAMLVNNVYAMDATDITLFVYDRTFIETITEDYFTDRNVKIVEVDLHPNPFGVTSDSGYFTPIELLRRIANIDEIRNAISQLDVLYVNGGGYFNSLWTQPHRIERLLQIMAPMVVAASMNKPVVFTANGFGPFRGDLEFFASFFRALPDSKFAVRDSLLSPFWLAQLGIGAEQITVLPDDLLFIDERLLREVEPLKAPYVVMETYLPVKFIESNLEHFEWFAQRMVKEHNLQVIFVPFNLGHGGVDQGRFLESHVEAIKFFDIGDRGYLSIEDASALVRNAELVVSSRYHAVILALSCGTPFVSVLKDVLGDKQYYFGKSVGALEGVLQGHNHNLNDYFFMDYLAALEAISDDFAGIVARQRSNYASAFPSSSVKLGDARKSYLGEGPAHGGSKI